ncbi:MAG: tRNA threonylcarbamoyladenosine dehydratase [Bacteroidales bacterium]|nr:tRNA threonylcarbamoyladenosine dehydratase [Bacteroidales bacterium]MBQ9529496.1 tRNA threonylcarbamoyladenosine dehydratase [Bacteroidales bacterium]
MAAEWQTRTALLMGDEALERLSRSTVAVVGVGGVGAYAAEMITRAGVGHLILLDCDVVSPSDKNRQMLALDSNMGRVKVEVISERLRDINPEIQIDVIADYLTEENVPQMLGGYNIDYLVDAIDTLAPKLALIEFCVKSGIPHVSSMGAGAKYDATKVRLVDLSKSYNCPLAYIVRKKLRKRGIEKGFKVVFSEELPEREAIVEDAGRNKKSQVGTISYMPAVFGCVCAQAAIDFLRKNH